jgi:hypothetical protein
VSAGNGSCNQVYGTTADMLTGAAWGIFQDYANRSYNLASSQITDLNGFTVEFIAWDASFNADGTLSGFVRPADPDLEPITPIVTDGVIPDAPTVDIAPVQLDIVPAEPTQLANLPELNLTVNAPDSLDDVARPSTAPTLDFGTAPTEPTLDVITMGELVEITIEDAPIVTIDTFDEEAPEFDAPVPSGSIDFTENPYVSELLDGIKVRINELMAGEGLPPAVAVALYGQLVDREDTSAIKMAQEVREDFASRGFDAEPNGLLAKRLLEVRKANRDKRSESARAVYIEEQKVVVENVRFAVAQGLQLEGQLIQAHMQVEQRRFDLAVKLQEIALGVFNAHVSAFNARVAGFNARIEAYKAFLEGQKAKVEVYKAQVEAAKVRGELNEQLVRVYEARIRAEITKVEVYKAQVEGYRARIEGERTRIEAYKGEVDAYRSFVEVYKAEWDAERTRIEAEVQRGRIYQTLAEVYASRVDVWRTKADVKIQNQRADIQVAQQYLQQHDAQVKTMLARLEAAKATLQAQVAQQQAAITLYQAKAGVEATAAEVDTREFAALAERENQRLQILLKDVDLRITQANQNASLLLRAMESASQASTQLTASAMSAINVSSAVSSGFSRSDNCSTAFNFSGEIADAE